MGRTWSTFLVCFVLGQGAGEGRTERGKGREGGGAEAATPSCSPRARLLAMLAFPRKNRFLHQTTSPYNNRSWSQGVHYQFVNGGHTPSSNQDKATKRNSMHLCIYQRHTSPSLFATNSQIAIPNDHRGMRCHRSPRHLGHLFPHVASMHDPVRCACSEALFRQMIRLHACNKVTRQVLRSVKEDESVTRPTISR